MSELFTPRMAIDLAYGRDHGGDAYLVDLNNNIFIGDTHPLIAGCYGLTEDEIVEAGRLQEGNPNSPTITLRSKSWQLAVPSGGEGRKLAAAIIREMVADHPRRIPVRYRE